MNPCFADGATVPVLQVGVGLTQMAATPRRRRSAVAPPQKIIYQVYPSPRAIPCIYLV